MSAITALAVFAVVVAGCGGGSDTEKVEIGGFVVVVPKDASPKERLVAEADGVYGQTNLNPAYESCVLGELRKIPASRVEQLYAGDKVPRNQGFFGAIFAAAVAGGCLDRGSVVAPNPNRATMKLLRGAIAATLPLRLEKLGVPPQKAACITSRAKRASDAQVVELSGASDTGIQLLYRWGRSCSYVF